MGVYGSGTKAVGESGGAVPALRPPAGSVRVQQLHPGANGGEPTIVPAPPRTAREAVDSGRCVRPGCSGLKQKGYHECAPHRLQTERVKAKRKAQAAEQAKVEQDVARIENGDVAEHSGFYTVDLADG